MPHSIKFVLTWVLAAAMASYFVRQCRKPSGWLGRFIVWTMNLNHAGLTSWGLKHVDVAQQDTILDIGFGGGRTLLRLAGMAALGKVYGVDYSETSVAASRA